MNNDSIFNKMIVASMFLIFIMIFFLAKIILYFYNNKKTFLEKINYIKIFLIKKLNNLLINIYYIIMNFCGVLATISICFYICYKSFSYEIVKAFKWRAELLNEDRQTDDFGGNYVYSLATV